MPSSFKFNVNVSKEWEGQVGPILDKWKRENEGNFSEKVCEAIVFLETATIEKIYEAIMQYDSMRTAADDSTSEQAHPWDKIIKGALEGDGDALYFLTKAQSGPLMSRRKAVVEIRRVQKIIQEERKAAKEKQLAEKSMIDNYHEFMNSLLEHGLTDEEILKQIRDEYNNGNGRNIIRKDDSWHRRILDFKRRDLVKKEPAN